MRVSRHTYGDAFEVTQAIVDGGPLPLSHYACGTVIEREEFGVCGRYYIVFVHNGRREKIHDANDLCFIVGSYIVWWDEDELKPELYSAEEYADCLTKE